MLVENAVTLVNSSTSDTAWVRLRLSCHKRGRRNPDIHGRDITVEGAVSTNRPLSGQLGLFMDADAIEQHIASVASSMLAMMRMWWFPGSIGRQNRKCARVKGKETLSTATVLRILCEGFLLEFS